MVTAAIYEGEPCVSKSVEYSIESYGSRQTSNAVLYGREKARMQAKLSNLK